MSNEMTIRGNTTPAVTTNDSPAGRKPLIDADQQAAFMAACEDAYKLINDFRKLAAANAKMREKQVDMLHREMKMLETEFKNEKTTAKRRAEIIERVGKLNDYMSEAMSNVKGENAGWIALGVLAFLCLLFKFLRSLR